MKFQPTILTLILAFVAGFATGRGGISLPDVLPIVGPVDPSPVPDAGFTVAIVREATDKGGMTPAQLSAIDSTEFHNYLASKNADWRKFDPDNPPTHEREKWQTVWEKCVAGKPKTAFPMLIVSNGKMWEVTSLPADLEGLMSVVRKYGDAK